MPKFVTFFLVFSVFVCGLAMGTYFGIQKKIGETPSSDKEIVPVQDVVIRSVQAKEEQEEEKVVTVSKEEIKLSPYAKMRIEKKYTKCGHTTVDVEDLPVELVNLTKEDIMEKYPNWEIRSFSANELSLFREIEANCNDHFVLKEKDGYLAIYSNITDDVVRLKEVTDIDVINLPEEDYETLRKRNLCVWARCVVKIN